MYPAQIVTLTFVDDVQTTPVSLTSPPSFDSYASYDTNNPNFGLYGNPLIAGIFLSLAASGSSAPAQTGYIQVGGLFAASLVQGTTYIATFSGTNAPVGSVSFVATGALSQTVVVPGYASPVCSQVGYASQQTKLWPRDWFGETARQWGGGAYLVALALAAAVEDLSRQVQGVILNARLQSSTGGNIDSWAADFFGTSLLRGSDTDTKYIARIEANLQAKRATPVGMESLLSYYASGGTVWIVEPFMPAQVGALGTPRWAMGSAYAGFGSQIPGPLFYLAGPVQQGAYATVLANRPCGMAFAAFEVLADTATPLVA